MTTSKTIRLVQTGLTPIDISPVWEGEEIQLFDMYIKGKWIGSRRTLAQCERYNNERST